MSRELLIKIERFLKEADMPPSVFGRHAANDPRLVSDLRAGRIIGQKLTSRVEQFLILWRDKLKAGEVIRCGDRRTRKGRAALAAASILPPSATAMPHKARQRTAHQPSMAPALLPSHQPSFARQPPFVRMQGAAG